MKCLYCEKTFTRKITFSNIFEKQETLCPNCKNNINIFHWKDCNIDLYYFDDYELLKDSIYRIKYYGEVEHAKKFYYHFKRFFKNKKFDMITVAPTNYTRETIRGFNPSGIILKICNIDYKEIFEKIYREKQSKLQKKRSAHKVNIQKNKIETIKNINNILIFDDIYTSGQTLKSLCGCLLIENPNLQITLLTLAKTKTK